jgi:hypothetical protein
MAPVGSPLWQRVPTEEDLRRFVARLGPGTLARSPVAALIECRIGTDGTLENCAVAEETSPRSGFGKSALGLMGFFRFATILPDGRSTDGGTVRIPLSLKGPVDLD